MIARKSLFAVSIQFFIRFVGWIGLVVLAKLWGSFAVGALGTIGVAMALVSVFNVIGDLGFGQANVKRISEGKDLGTCLGTFTAIKLLLTGIMVAILVAGIYIWRVVLHGNFTDATTETVVLVFIVYYIFYNIQSIPITTFNGTGEIAKLQLTSMTENSLKIPLTIIVALAGVSLVSLGSPVHWPAFLEPLRHFIASHPVGSLAMTYVFGMVASCVVGFWLLRKYPWKRPNRELASSYFVFALPTLLVSVVVTISTNIDKLFIGYFWTNTEVGYYFSVQQILQIMLIIAQVMIIVLFPMFSKYHSDKRVEKIQEITLSAERYISLIMIPIVVVLLVFSAPIISIMLNSSFLPAVSVLTGLTFYALVSSFTAPYTALVIGMNKPMTAAKNSLMVCIINITLNVVLIPRNGLLSSFGISGPTGAAVATTISATIGFIGLKIVARRLTKIKLVQPRLFFHVLAGLVMAGVLELILHFVTVNRWFSVLFFAVVGLLIYLGILSVLKEFRKVDLDFFLNLLRPKEMLQYLKTEIKGNGENNK